MIIAVPKEILPDERRVALTPDAVGRLVSAKLTLRVEAGAGEAAGFSDAAYDAVGAELVADGAAAWRDADVVVKVQPPLQDAAGADELGRVRERLVLVGMLQPLVNHALVRELARRRVTSFSLDALPRISRAQPMDALSAMSTVAGYKAVLLAAARLGKFFPMLVTAAGTVAPARVLVLGAGVAGLQAIATARRLGAVVEAFDVRPEVKEQVESLGARFLEVAEAVTVESVGGYATELSDEQHRRELELIHRRIREADVVITTALIPGKRAPVLITEEMVQDMRPGGVIVDLAAELGGNCALTERGHEVVRHGVMIAGPVNLAATMPHHASQMYARNLSAFLGVLLRDGALTLDFDDEIIGGTCITHEGQIVHAAVKGALEGAD